MLKHLILRNSDPVDGNGKPAKTELSQPASQAAPEPPEAAKVVATGKKTEREIQLEEENTKLRKAVAKTAESKRKAETHAAYLKDENDRLKTPTPAPSQQPAKEKLSWMGFGRQ